MRPVPAPLPPTSEVAHPARGLSHGPSERVTAVGSSQVAAKESRVEEALIQEARRRHRRRRRIVASLFMVVALVLTGIAGGFVIKRLGGARPAAAGYVNRSLSVPHARRYVEPKAPGALAIGPNGNLFVADNTRDQVLERLGNGHFVVVAGNGKHGFPGDGGPAVKAEINDPGGMAFGPGGALYFADSGNNRVRRVGINGSITTVVGTPGRWSGPATDGERALQAHLSSPSDVAFGPDGQLYIADTATTRSSASARPRGWRSLLATPTCTTPASTTWACRRLKPPQTVQLASLLTEPVTCSFSG